jgi:cytochrome P460
MTQRNRNCIAIACLGFLAAGFTLIGVLMSADAQRPKAPAAVVAVGVKTPAPPDWAQTKITSPSNRDLDPLKTLQLLSDEGDILAAVMNGFSEPRPSSPTRFLRVTERPYRVEPVSTTLCRLTGKGGPHSDHWIHVYVTGDGQGVMRSGRGVYPEGTVILKQKFADAEGKKTELFTGMLKRRKGYNPEMGDWEFFVLDASHASVLAYGKIESCSECHASFKQTDFVSREYMAAVGK